MKMKLLHQSRGRGKVWGFSLALVLIFALWPNNPLPLPFWKIAPFIFQKARCKSITFPSYLLGAVRAWNSQTNISSWWAKWQCLSNLWWHHLSLQYHSRWPAREKQCWEWSALILPRKSTHQLQRSALKLKERRDENPLLSVMQF